MYELVYTSAEHGLRRGTRGFCTVACTDGLTPNMVLLLEQLSAYRHLASPNSAENPVIRSHVIARQNGLTYHILSRVADAGLDYTNRSNKIAHHLILTEQETMMYPAGPAELLAHEDLFYKRWDAEPKVLPTGRRFPQNDVAPQICVHWQNAAGDAGWGGCLAVSGEAGIPACLSFCLAQDLLPLFQESILLLPAAKRWNVSFTTFFTKYPPNVQCLWKGVLAGTPEEGFTRAVPNSLILNLAGSNSIPLPNDPKLTNLIEFARTGKKTAPAKKPRPQEYIDEFYTQDKQNHSEEDLDAFLARTDLRPDPALNSSSQNDRSLYGFPIVTDGNSELLSNRKRKKEFRQFWVYGSILLAILALSTLIVLVTLSQSGKPEKKGIAKKAAAAKNVQNNANQPPQAETTNDEKNNRKPAEPDKAPIPLKEEDNSKQDNSKQKAVTPPASSNKLRDKNTEKKEGESGEGRDKNIGAEEEKTNNIGKSKESPVPRIPENKEKDKPLLPSDPPKKPAVSPENVQPLTSVPAEYQAKIQKWAGKVKELKINPQLSSMFGEAAAAKDFFNADKNLFDELEKDKMRIELELIPLVAIKRKKDNKPCRFTLNSDNSDKWQLNYVDADKNEKLFEIDINKNHITPQKSEIEIYKQLAMFSFITIKLTDKDSRKLIARDCQQFLPLSNDFPVGELIDLCEEVINNGWTLAPAGGVAGDGSSSSKNSGPNMDYVSKQLELQFCDGSGIDTIYDLIKLTKDYDLIKLLKEKFGSNESIKEKKDKSDYRIILRSQNSVFIIKDFKDNDLLKGDFH